MTRTVSVLVMMGVLSGADRPPAAASEPRVLVVVAAGAYREPLEPWLEARRAQGYRIELVDPEPILRSETGRGAVAAIGRQIERLVPPPRGDESGAGSVRKSGNEPPPGFVLLVGDAPGLAEPIDPAAMIPASLHPRTAYPSWQGEFASDNVYALPDALGRARLAVGRWPVRTRAEVEVQVRKALRYEREQSPGPHRRDLTFLATTPNYGPAVDPVLEQMAMNMLSAQIKPQWGLRAVYSSPRSEFFPGPTATREMITRWLEESTPMTLFAGHGYDRGVDFVRYADVLYPVLDSDQASRIRGTRPGTVLWISACSCGDFDLDDQGRGLAEALVMNPDGPTAAVAGSDITSAWANLLGCLGLAHDVIEQPPATLGEAFLRFKFAAFKPGPQLLKNMLLNMERPEQPDRIPVDQQFLYNLLGDPTLPLRLPGRADLSVTVTELTSDDPAVLRYRIAGTLADWPAATVCVALNVDRLSHKVPVANPALIPDETARRAAYLERFLKSNDKTAAQCETVSADGRFEAELSVPAELAPKVRWLQVYMYTNGDSGSWRDAVAAQPIRLGEPVTKQQVNDE